MMEFIKNSAFFGAMISLIAYEIGLILKKKFKMAIFNPLLISIICVIGVLLLFHIDYDDYNEGGKYISYLLTPATVCLAVPLYEQIHLLKKNLKAVAAGIFSGTLAGLCSVLLMAKLFGFDHQEYVTMLPKSITTAIGMGVSEELGGIVTITVAVIIITGVLGNMIAEVVYKIAKIEEPIAKGLGLGTSAHAIGTAKAMELAVKEAGISTDDVWYVNAHGTSTHHNDLFETIAIKKTFGEHAKEMKINSTKSITGHLLGAAGAVEVITCVKELQEGLIHQTVGYKVPDEQCDLDYVGNGNVKMDIKYALTNSLGFGGHNASLLIKKYED